MKTLSPTTLIPERQQSRVELAAWLTRIANGLRAIGPYAAIEIVLPGGTLFALLLWLYRRNGRTMSKARIWLRRMTEKACVLRECEPIGAPRLDTHLLGGLVGVQCVCAMYVCSMELKH